MCSSARGRASARSLVTWPTRITVMPVVLAARVRWAAHSRTWATEPGAEDSWSEYTVCMESMTTTAGWVASMVARIFSSWISASTLTWLASSPRRSEEHTSELQSHSDLVCRLLLEKKKQR